MNVIPQAGSIGSGVIVTKNYNLLSFSGGHLKYRRDQMGLGVMSFAAFSRWIDSGLAVVSV
jgi:hypothetical protein